MLTSAVIVLLAIGAGYYFLSNGPLPTTAEIPQEEELEILRKISSRFPGEIVFDSNRSGTFGIYATSLDGSGLRKLVDTELHEMFPDPSPDGKLVVFARSKDTERGGNSSIWLAPVEGNLEGNSAEPRKLADNATFPTFSADGKFVYFERDRNRVMSINVDGTGEREVFPAGKGDFANYKFQIVKPRVSADERYVFFTTDKDGRWNAFYADVNSGEAFHLHRGCEPTPFNKGGKAAWVNKRHVLDRSGIGQVDLKTKTTTKLQDAGAPRGHEYFPTLAADDQFLLYSACREREHSHETSNYQVFVKDLNTGDVARVTFDEYTNRWPKLLRKIAR